MIKLKPTQHYSYGNLRESYNKPNIYLKLLWPGITNAYLQGHGSINGKSMRLRAINLPSDP